jgi:hypothetical protein
MTVNVPQTHKSGTYEKQQQIAAVGARPDYQSVQHKNQLETELVLSLLDEGKLQAAHVIANVAFKGANPQATAIAKWTALVASYGATGPGNAASLELDKAQRQAVSEMMASGQMTAASVLSSESYSGG